MSRLGKYTRRGFIIASVAVAGGVVFGARTYNARLENPLLGGLAPGEAALTPYVKITADGVTVITPRAEMGQGIHTTLAALVAEELDVELADIRIEHGPPSPAYYNGGVIEEGYPFPATDTGAIAEFARAQRDIPAVFLGYQITGGSTSTHDAYEKMRRAGAIARETLKAAAAARTGIAVAQLTTDAGAVVLPDATRLPYTDLAAEAGAIDLADAPELRPRSAWRILGHSQDRLDVIDKSTGRAVYASDIRLPGMRFGAVRRSPHLGGTLRSFDATAALAIPGVDTVIDIGDGVVAIATNTWMAMQALDAVTFDWASPDYPMETAGHFEAIARAFRPEQQDSQPRDDGNVDEALAGADVIEGEYRAPYLAHVTMEPMSAAAWMQDGALHIWAGTQGPTVARREAALAAGIREDAVTITTTLLGGGFGRRGEMDFVQIAAKVGAQMNGTPVLLTYPREEDTSRGPYRPAAIGRFRAAIRDGVPVAVDISTASPSIMSGIDARGGAPAPIPGFVPDFTVSQALWDQPYGIANYRATGYRPDALLPVGFWRSVGASQNTFFHEGMMDELAVAAARDPVEMRLQLMTDAPSRAVLEAVAAMADWGTTPAAGRARGVAFALAFGVPVAQIVEIEHTENGLLVRDVWVAADVGIALDPRNLDAQLVSGVNFGLSAAIGEEITVSDGKVEQSNYHDYPILRMYHAPRIHTRILENQQHIRGIGEPGTPCTAPALGNAIHALTGQRLREMPFGKTVRFA
ncbi:xanthine dehydrogenase family protein molybdopterin-binding subunit [Roseicitreum antarcticum]|uniref:Isoquinoline 1-oxidoreductase, beta subunit n=1 Tax=Roseicitreum antarcticum TaxID=564137 RepID=A0A1H2ZQ20_9RHOB|nr:molybdopterin cofactor-binding domain-containing protein [Roseicitreum antarcticum]SDX18998.1 isoquinoline 1-oxidoreductase, beta subunit [Roseicitreum antarcticum]